ncbi:MAG: hypothetical protein ACJAYB_000100 [Psychromonas sp.]|jgi:hypothetical protein
MKIVEQIKWYSNFEKQISNLGLLVMFQGDNLFIRARASNCGFSDLIVEIKTPEEGDAFLLGAKIALTREIKDGEYQPDTVIKHKKDVT